MEAALEDEMKVLLQHETEKLRKKLSGAHADDPLSIRRDLAGKDPVQILLSVFDACNNHFRGPQQAKVSAFMQTITVKPALRHLFLLAIYEGAYGAHTLMPKFMEDCFPAQSTGAPQQQDVFYQSQGVYYVILCECGDFVRLVSRMPPSLLKCLATCHKIHIPTVSFPQYTFSNVFLAYM